MYPRMKLMKCVVAAYACVMAVGALLYEAGAAAADTPIQAPYCAAGDPNCFKEIRIFNNMNSPIYPVVQASIITQQALDKNGEIGSCRSGDPWLQRALQPDPTAAITDCHAVEHDYYVYLNPGTGIAPGQMLSISLPWWVKTDAASTGGAYDPYIDFWNAGRLYIFDDKQSLNDSYVVNTTDANVYSTAASGSNKLKFDPLPGLPKISCTARIPGSNRPAPLNVCDPNQTVIAVANPQVPGSMIGPPSFYQLNEYTFADVTPIFFNADNSTSGGVLIDLNQNYNVSNVDQVYLPVALGPIQEPATVGYLGTIKSNAKFQAAMRSFTGVDVNPKNPTWPIYNNPVIDGKKLYPNAGIRVPSPLSAFGFYMNPGTFAITKNGKTNSYPFMVPYDPTKPFDRSKLPKKLLGMELNWEKCSSEGATCPRSEWYRAIKDAFDLSYQTYLNQSSCDHPDWLKPDSPTFKEAYLYFVSGWVPFRNGVGCTKAQVPELPVTGTAPSTLVGKGLGGEAPFYYTDLQYDWSLPTSPAKGADLFNPYTQFVHGSGSNQLNAATYAFSIDDRQSYLNNSGGSLPGGLIFAIGGPRGLVVKTPAPKPPPIMLDWYTARVALGGPNTQNTGWKRYGICSNVANKRFPNNNPGGLGLNPNVLPPVSSRSPCMITLQDENNKIYQFKLNRLKVTGPLPIEFWPAPYPANRPPPALPSPLRPATATCVKANYWCSRINEIAFPNVETTEVPQFYLVGPPPDTKN